MRVGHFTHRTVCPTTGQAVDWLTAKVAAPVCPSCGYMNAEGTSHLVVQAGRWLTPTWWEEFWYDKKQEWVPVSPVGEPGKRAEDE